MFLAKVQKVGFAPLLNAVVICACPVNSENAPDARIPLKVPTFLICPALMPVSAFAPALVTFWSIND